MTEKNQIQEFNTEEMIQRGMHLGRITSKLNPKMKPFIIGIKNNCHIINLEKTKEHLLTTLKFIEDLKKEGKVILFVATNPPINKIVENFAKEINYPFITNRWLGGLLTNFPEIRKRVNYYKNLKKQFERGEIEKYTKKERTKISKKLKDLKIKFEGIENLEKIPDAIFLADVSKEKTAVNEAKKMKIPIIGLCNTNANPTDIKFLIPVNTNAIPSVEYILEEIKKVISKNK